MQCACLQQRVIVALHHRDGIGRNLFLCHEPRRAGTGFFAADPDALALTDGVEHQADVLADGLAMFIDHRARLLWQIAIQKFAERPFTDKTNPGRIFFGVISQARLGGNPAHFSLFDIRERKQHPRQLQLIQAMQKIALVFAGVCRAQQLEAAAAATRATGSTAATPLAHAGVMPGGDFFRAQLDGMIQKGLELDLGIAQNVGVGGAPSGVFAQKIGEHPVFIFGGKVDGLKINPHYVRCCGGIDQIFAGGAIFIIIVIFPIFHEKANDLVTRTFQQPCGDR